MIKKSYHNAILCICILQILTLTGCNLFVSFINTKNDFDIIVSPKDASLFCDEQLQFRAYKITADGISEDVTGRIGWTSSDTRILDFGSSGLAIPVTDALSTVNVSASLDDRYDNAKITILQRPKKTDNQIQNPSFEVDFLGWQPGCAEIAMDGVSGKCAFIDDPGCVIRQRIFDLEAGACFRLDVDLKGLDSQSKVNIKVQNSDAASFQYQSSDNDWHATSFAFTVLSSDEPVTVEFQRVQSGMYIDNVIVRLDS